MPRKPTKRRTRPREDDDPAGNGLLARVVDRTFENPAMSGGLLVMALTAAAIASNALFLQNGRHPDPLFMTGIAPVAAKPQAAARSETAGSRASILIDDPPMPRLAPRPPAAPIAPVPAAAVLPADMAGLPPQDVASPSVQDETSAASLITDVQRELARIGLYRGAIDGVPGARTEAAIRDFETAAGIAVTGRPSPTLLVALRQPLPPRETRSIASTNSEAAELNRREQERAQMIAAEELRQAEITRREAYQVVQTALNRIGYGPLPVDGATGPETSDAIRRFELDHGMPLTGEAGDGLIARLFAIGAIKPG